eukprot:14514500-Alexandrium_andersonii.AAC.1
MHRQEDSCQRPVSLFEGALNARGREWKTLGGMERSASSCKEKAGGIEHRGETWSFSGQMANDD